MSDTLNPEVENYISNLNTQLEAERSRRLNVETQLGNISQFGSSGNKEQNVVEFQLELEKELDKIYHLLSGHEIKTDRETKSEYWVEPEDDRLKTFSIYGVKQIMNLLSIYVNKNTLLGFYQDEVIRWKVRDFAIELSDLFLNRYEALLYYPTPEDLFEKYLPMIRNGSYNIKEDELYQKCVKWSTEELNAKENLLPIIALSIIDMVHSTYTRSFLGKERTSIGEKGININQTSNPGQNIFTEQKKGGFLGFMKG